MIRSCTKCCKDRPQAPEPLIPSIFPTLPWQRVATDLFDWKGSKYLLIVDYYSRYIETARLSGESSAEVIRHTKSVFARHGIPQVVVSDNGPQFSSIEFCRFAAEYGFTHTTSSPRYPQSNGEAKRAVKTVKELLKRTEDPYLAMLTYRSTPLQNGYSPAELLMSRRLRTTLPTVESQLKPFVPDYETVKRKEDDAKRKQKEHFDIRHRVRNLDPLLPGDLVWIPDHNTSGTVVQSTATRSYQVSTPTGSIRRNRRHLTLLPEQDPPTQEHSQEDNTPQETSTGLADNPGDGVTITRSGRVSVPPTRLDPSSN